MGHRGRNDLPAPISTDYDPVAISTGAVERGRKKEEEYAQNYP